MVENYALIENNVIINVILWDGTSKLELPEGQTLVSLKNSDAWIGWKYLGSAFEQPSS